VVHANIYKNNIFWYYIIMEIIQDHIDWSLPGVKLSKIQEGILGSPIALVVGEEVALTMAIDKPFADILISADRFEENQDTDEINKIFYVNIIKDTSTIKFRCTEMVYVILLSDPIIIELNDSYKYYRNVSPGWSYINEEFVLPGLME